MIALGWQKAEGIMAAVAGLVIAIAVQPDWPWWVWPLILLAPDLTIVGYLAGPRAGAAAYNATHLYGTGILLAALGVVVGPPVLVAIGALWMAHAGLDRAFGFGLKSPEGFRITHLGRIGRDPDQPPS